MEVVLLAVAILLGPFAWTLWRDPVRQAAIGKLEDNLVASLIRVTSELSRHHTEIHSLGTGLLEFKRSTAEDLANLWKRVRYNSDGMSTLHDGAAMLRDRQQRLEQQLADSVASLSASSAEVANAVSALRSTIKPSAIMGRKG